MQFQHNFSKYSVFKMLQQQNTKMVRKISYFSIKIKTVEYLPFIVQVLLCISSFVRPLYSLLVKNGFLHIYISFHAFYFYRNLRFFPRLNSCVEISINIPIDLNKNIKGMKVIGNNEF